MNIELIRKSYEEILMHNIRKKGKEITSPEEIWDNLDFLAEEIQVYNEVQHFLPLPTKQLLAFIADPYHSISVTTVTWSDNGETCSVTCHFKWSDAPDGWYAEGFAKRSYSDIFPQQSLSAGERKALLEPVVRGLALSRAYTAGGIGLQYRCDNIDTAIDKMEQADIERKLESKLTESVPEIPSAEEKKAAKAAARGKRSAAATASTTHPDTPVPEQEPQESATPAVPKASEEIAISLEEARNMVADIGNYAGTPLGKMYDASPASAKNLVWLANNPASAVSEAARVIVSADEELAKYLK